MKPYRLLSEPNDVPAAPIGPAIRSQNAKELNHMAHVIGTFFYFTVYDAMDAANLLPFACVKWLLPGSDWSNCLGARYELLKCSSSASYPCQTGATITNAEITYQPMVVIGPPALRYVRPFVSTAAYS